MSTLSEYLKTHGVSQSDFADRVGITQSVVSKLVARSVAPKLTTALRIEEATGGEVRPCDLTPLAGQMSAPAPVQGEAAQ